MKKVISLMLAAAMVFGLAACGSPKQPEQEAPVETEAPAETEEPAETEAPAEAAGMAWPLEAALEAAT